MTSPTNYVTPCNLSNELSVCHSLKMARANEPKALGNIYILYKTCIVFQSNRILKLLDSNSVSILRQCERNSKKICKINADISYLEHISSINRKQIIRS